MYACVYMRRHDDLKHSIRSYNITAYVKKTARYTFSNDRDDLAACRYIGRNAKLTLCTRTLFKDR